jgi:hypothetical protein
MRAADKVHVRAPADIPIGAIYAFALAGLFAAEIALFWANAVRHYAWVYPRWSDQLQYLREAYGSYDRMQSDGFLGGARQALGTKSAQGSLQGLLGMIAFSIGGPVRTPALAVNLAAFICLQAAMFAAVRRLSGSLAFAWAAAGLLAAMHSPWSDVAGSATDYRLDWMAACAYGVALAAAVSGSGFRSTRGAVLFGFAVGAALLVRHLTAVYFSIVYVGLLAWLLFQPDWRRRCARLLLSGACALALSAWAFWRSWQNIYAYYWIDRFVGPESALRDSHMGLIAYLRWLGFELLFHQLGIAAALLGVAGAAGFLAFGLCRARKELAPEVEPGAAQGAWPAVLAFLCAPAAVLLLHPEKAPQPLNIMIPGAAWVIVLSWMGLARRAPRLAVVATCAALGSAGALLFVWAQARNPFTPAMESEFRGVNALTDFLYFRAQESGLSRPSVAVTWVSDAMNADVFEVQGRERHLTRLPFVARLPSGVLEDAPADVMSRLAASDFVCLVTRAPANWPLDREMEAMLPQMRKWCDANLRRDGDLHTAGFSASIYERRELGRPPGGAGVDLSSMISAASVGPPDAPASLPGPPALTMPRAVSWTTLADFSYAARAAYGPVTFSARSLPEGISLNPLTGELRGHFRTVGSFTASLEARNAAGSARADLVIVVGDQPWDVSISPPPTARVGKSLDIGYTAFDSRGWLDFIDVTDLTAAKFVERIAANDDERRNWQGIVRTTFREGGEHRIQMRFVRYDPAGDGTYSFLDRDCVVGVAP